MAKVEIIDDGRHNTTALKLVYILYIAGILLPFTPLIGAIICHIKRTPNMDVLPHSHYTYLIRTFWIGILYTAIGIVLSLVLVGFLILFATFIWFAIRVILGFIAIFKPEPIRNVYTWLI